MIGTDRGVSVFDTKRDTLYDANTDIMLRVWCTTLPKGFHYLCGNDLGYFRWFGGEPLETIVA